MILPQLSRRPRPVALGLLLSVSPMLASCQAAGSRSGGAFLDGSLDEWSAAETIIEDEADAQGAAVDIRWVKAMDDGQWLLLAFDLTEEVNAQSLPGTLHLLVDTDDEAGTGVELRGMAGVDLVIDLSHKEDATAQVRGAGFSMRAVGADGTLVEQSGYALGVTVAPTWAASEFELRVSRLGAPGIAALGERLRMKMVYAEGDEVVDASDVGRYAFRTTAAAVAKSARVEWTTKAEGSTRVAVWNVSGRSFTSNTDGFARVLAAVDADVVLLDEVVRWITPETVAAFFDLEPLRRLGSWEFVIGQSGGRQRTVVAARGRAVRPAQTMRTMYYGEGELEALADRLPPELDRLVEVEGERGLSATGAWIDMGGTDVLFVPVDLQSAGWTGSPQDQLRVLQARTIHQRAAAEKGDAPVVIGGDLNLVGSRAPLLVLLESLDSDGSDLIPVDAERIGEPSHSTWRFAQAPFAPGRLDFLLVPDAAVDVTNSFVFATDDLSADELGRLGLETDLSEQLSDHLVVVADLRLR